MDMEMEFEDERKKDPMYLMGRDLSWIKPFYCTQRSRTVSMKIHYWIKDGEDPYGDDGSFLTDCCIVSFDLYNHIITKYYAPVLHHFRPFFPELDSLVEDPISYLRVVKKIYGGNEARNVVFSDALLMDLQQQGLFTPSMVTTVVALRSSLTHVPRLSGETLGMIKQAFLRSLSLDQVRNRVEGFVSGRIGLLAPNLSALVGLAVAAKLVGAAGGLTELSAMPLSNIMLLNSASAIVRNDPYDDLIREKYVTWPPLFEDYTPQEQQLPESIVRCFIGQTDIISTTHQRLKSKACHSLAETINLAATIDLSRADMTGGKGGDMREEICRMINKWMEEDSSSMLMEMRAHLIVRPKKNKLAISEKYSQIFKPNKEKKKKNPPYDTERIKRREDRVLAYLQDFKLVTPTNLQSSIGS